MKFNFKGLISVEVQNIGFNYKYVTLREFVYVPTFRVILYTYLCKNNNQIKIIQRSNGVDDLIKNKIHVSINK